MVAYTRTSAIRAEVLAHAMRALKREFAVLAVVLGVAVLAERHDQFVAADLAAVPAP
jgi:hypothetical protein